MELLLHSSELLLHCLEQALLGCDQIDETLDADSPLAYFLSECFDSDSIHACYRRKTTPDQLRQFSRFSKISPQHLTGRPSRGRAFGAPRRSAYNWQLLTHGVKVLRLPKWHAPRITGGWPPSRTMKLAQGFTSGRTSFCRAHAPYS